MQYIIRKLSTEWKVSQLYLPQIEAADCVLYEVIFTKFKNQDKIKVCLPVPKEINEKETELFYSDNGKKLIKLQSSIIHGEIQFTTDKMGVFVIMKNIEKPVKIFNYNIKSLLNINKKIAFNSKNDFLFDKMK